jgi:hypothetical protein
LIILDNHVGADMQNWVIEADIHRLKHAMPDAARHDRAKMAQPVRRAGATRSDEATWARPIMKLHETNEARGL